MILFRYMRWLHTRWPAGHVEKLPVLGEDGEAAMPGVYVVGDLRGIPLLKYAVDTGARTVRKIAADLGQVGPPASAPRSSQPVDLVIIGAGVSGVAAAIEAANQGFAFALLESNEPFFTIVNFPRGKSIFTYPREMVPAGGLHVTAQTKEELLAELRGQLGAAGISPVRARADRIVRVRDMLEVQATPAGREGASAAPCLFKTRSVIVAVGRSGDFRRLGIPGEDLDKVFNRLHDPRDFAGKRCLVVGGGDSALETATALVTCGAEVTLSYRKPEFARAKPENIAQVSKLADSAADAGSVEEPVSERVTTAVGTFLPRNAAAGTLRLALSSTVAEIRETSVVLKDSDGAEVIDNDFVFPMIGREPPFEFLRRSGIRIHGDWSWRRILAFAAFLILCVFLYHWKASGSLNALFQENKWFPYSLPAHTMEFFHGSPQTDARSPFTSTLAVSIREPGFYYALAYSLLVADFGVRRIMKRRTPYIAAQTSCLAVVQILPLFLLPYLLLPLAGNHGWFSSGVGRDIADSLFPVVAYGHGREYWRAFGFVLAWPLFIWNFLTDKPLAAWLWIGSIQTFFLVPLMIRFWGKGAYCGWICSCGALAETLGDAHRQKMPHGPRWNRLNMLGQAILLFALVTLALRIWTWISPATPLERAFRVLLDSYYWLVDITLAGIVGLGCYFWFSGRVWCRFACPLAALMHIYARFSRFRIFADKKKCISCNICTSVCHQGIDVMNFANKGVPMADPQCVRCSACVQSCPTGVLAFGRYGRDGTERPDRLAASPVRMHESTPEREFPGQAKVESSR
jgi:thioredoxin reductase/ferredoxin